VNSEPKPIKTINDYISHAMDLARQEERQNVVALLRASIDGVIEEACLVAADMIERGDHRREEKE
jgi:hypothetical protein